MVSRQSGSSFFSPSSEAILSSQLWRWVAFGLRFPEKMYVRVYPLSDQAFLISAKKIFPPFLKASSRPLLDFSSALGGLETRYFGQTFPRAFFSWERSKNINMSQPHDMEYSGEKIPRFWRHFFPWQDFRLAAFSLALTNFCAVFLPPLFVNGKNEVLPSFHLREWLTCCQDQEDPTAY